MKQPRLVLLWVALLAHSVAAVAAQRIESTYFPSPNLELEGHWLVAQPRANTDADAFNAIVAQSAVTELRLTIPPPYVGKRVRIFMVLPIANEGMSNGQGLMVEWRAQGVYLSGQGRPGERALFFQGVVAGNVLRDNITYTFHIDGRYTSGPVRFEPVYEIEEQ
jgi:hypothetical protein